MRDSIPRQLPFPIVFVFKLLRFGKYLQSKSSHLFHNGLVCSPPFVSKFEFQTAAKQGRRKNGLYAPSPSPQMVHRRLEKSTTHMYASHYLDIIFDDEVTDAE